MRIALVIYLLLLTTILVARESPEERFYIANQLYQDKNYQQAANRYQQLVDEGFDYCKLYYNLGNAYFRVDSLALAIYNYEKALKIDPNNEDAVFNLQFANQLITIKAESYPEIFYVRWWRQWVNSMNASTWGILCLLLIWIALGLGIGYLYASSPPRKRQFFIGAIAALVLSFLFCFNAYAKYQNESSNDWAILFADTLFLKNGPSENSKDLFKLSAGNKLEIVETIDEWIKVRISDEKEGWVHENHLKVI